MFAKGGSFDTSSDNKLCSMALKSNDEFEGVEAWRLFFSCGSSSAYTTPRTTFDCSKTGSSRLSPTPTVGMGGHCELDEGVLLAMGVVSDRLPPFLLDIEEPCQACPIAVGVRLMLFSRGLAI